jgi:hypothetical protein
MLTINIDTVRRYGFGKQDLWSGWRWRGRVNNRDFAMAARQLKQTKDLS